MSVSQHVDLMVSRSGSRPAATVRDLGVMFHAASITSVRDPGSFLRVMMNSPYRPQGAGTQHTRVVYAFKLIRKNAYVRTAGPGSLDPEHDGSTPAETKIVTIVLPSCIILKL